MHHALHNDLPEADYGLTLPSEGIMPDLLSVVQKLREKGLNFKFFSPHQHFELEMGEVLVEQEVAGLVRPVIAPQKRDIRKLKPVAWIVEAEQAPVPYIFSEKEIGPAISKKELRDFFAVMREVDGKRLLHGIHLVPALSSVRPPDGWHWIETHIENSEGRGLTFSLEPKAIQVGRAVPTYINFISRFGIVADACTDWCYYDTEGKHHDRHFNPN